MDLGSRGRRAIVCAASKGLGRGSRAAALHSEAMPQALAMLANRHRQQHRRKHGLFAIALMVLRGAECVHCPAGTYEVNPCTSGYTEITGDISG